MAGIPCHVHLGVHLHLLRRSTIWQKSRIKRGRISDIKYHYILMHVGADSYGLNSIQSKFRYPVCVKQIKQEVKDYEERVQETACALDQKQRLEEKINKLNSQTTNKNSSR